MYAYLLYNISSIANKHLRQNHSQHRYDLTNLYIHLYHYISLSCYIHMYLIYTLSSLYIHSPHHIYLISHIYIFPTILNYNNIVLNKSSSGCMLLMYMLTLSSAASLLLMYYRYLY